MDNIIKIFFRSLGSCVHVTSVLLGMGVSPDQRGAFTIDESIAFTSETFPDSNISFEASSPVDPRTSKRVRLE